jgi:hypothetical protein
MLGKGIEEGALIGLGSTRDLAAAATGGGGGGEEEEPLAARAELSSEFVGIVPRCISDMFVWIDKQQQVNAANNSSMDYSITANYLQIYNEVRLPCICFLLCLCLSSLPFYPSLCMV